MKPFNLEEALGGKLVELRSGKRARILVDLSRVSGIKYNDSVLVGVTLADDGCAAAALLWKKDGSHESTDCLNIAGMHEAPAKPQNKILEEAWQNRGKIVKTDADMITVVEVVAKTIDGEYIVRNPVTGSLDEISTYGKLNWQPYEEPTGPVDNHKVATLYLPKPNRPREGKSYWCISTFNGKLRVQHEIHSHTWACDRNRIEQGNCFASESDAQA